MNLFPKPSMTNYWIRESEKREKNEQNSRRQQKICIKATSAQFGHKKGKKLVSSKPKYLHDKP